MGRTRHVKTVVRRNTIWGDVPIRHHTVSVTKRDVARMARIQRELKADDKRGYASRKGVGFKWKLACRRSKTVYARTRTIAKKLSRQGKRRSGRCKITKAN
jgi:hypothetical protein